MFGYFAVLVLGLALGVGISWYTSRTVRGHEQEVAANQALQEKQELHAEAVLQKRAAVQSLFEAFVGGAATLDDHGRILGYNRALQERLGYGDEELTGRSFLNLVHPQDVGDIQEFLQNLVALKSNPITSPNSSCEIRFYSKESELVWIQLSLSVLHDSDLHAQHPFLVLALLDDVTRRHQAEGVASRLNAGVHDLYHVIADQQSDPDSQMKALLNLGCRLFGVSTGLLGKFSDAQLEIMAVVSPDSRLRVGHFYEMGQHEMTAKRLELPAPLRSDEKWDWRSHPFVTVTEGETFLAAPIYIAGRLSGLLSFSDPSPRETSFEPEQTQFCQLMALWIGSEIERRHRQSVREKEEAALLQANARLTALAAEDGLTGLKNRRAFDEKLQAQFARAQRSGVPVSLLLLDVDKFKLFNDSFGHPAGDEVLRRVARLVQSSVRDDGFVARYGGEEFAVLLPNTTLQNALITAERVRCRIESGEWTHRAVTASIGVSCWSPEMTVAQQLIDAADAALYQSKERGRNRVTQGSYTE